MKRNPIEKEWLLLGKKEQKLIESYHQAKTFILQDKLEKIVPDGLQGKLDKAFIKGFQIVFEKGIPIIEKTYGKEAYEVNYKIQEYISDLKQDRKSLRAFTNKAKLANTKNKLITSVEGLFLGAVGVGLPDIPLFIGVLLKSIYEIALSYGFTYDTEDEKLFILKLIDTAMCYGDDFVDKDNEINTMLTNFKNNVILAGNIKAQIDITAKTLSSELLYMKFLQGIPIAGIIGGLSDVTSHNRITEYCLLKYQKRFLMNKIS